MRKRLKDMILVSFGAVPGALIRFQVGNDLLVNIMGATILGILFGLRLPNRYQIIIGFGFCGALTTFSSWMANIVELIANSFFIEAIFNLLIPIFLGILASVMGFFLAKYFSSSMLPRLRSLAQHYLDQ